MSLIITPDWPAPPQVRAATTTRASGVSRGPYATFNLGKHVGDDPHAVADNRAHLHRLLDLPSEPLWLQQVHGIQVVDAGEWITTPTAGVPQADAALAHHPHRVCAVLTADCLPVLLCSRDGHHIAAAHAGWRGLAAGILEATVLALEQPGSTLMAWLGPAIGPQVFEVGDEVRHAFVSDDAQASSAFARHPTADHKWHANLYALARQRLARVGVTAIYGGEYCTYTQARQFYSFRREGVTGRMATLVWRQR